MPTRTAVMPQRRPSEIYEDVWGRQFYYMKKFAVTMAGAFMFLTFVELILASFACSQMCAARKCQEKEINAIKGEEIGFEANSLDEYHSVQKEDFEGTIPATDGELGVTEYDCEKELEEEKLPQEPEDSRSELINACDAFDGLQINNLPANKNPTMIQKLSGFLERLYEKYALRYDVEDQSDIGADRVIILNILQFAAAQAS